MHLAIAAAAAQRLANRPERFWANVDKSDDCWLWEGGVVTAAGYGQTWWDGRPQPAHRVAYELLYGPVPDGCQLHHHCENKNCVRPEHLLAVTARQHSDIHVARKTTCKRGHTYDTINSRGARTCSICSRMATKRRRERLGDAAFLKEAREAMERYRARFKEEKGAGENGYRNPSRY